jgi:phosphopantothenoylcysteine synthetase/decarboxylase
MSPTGQDDPATARRFLIGACGSVGVINLHEYLLALRLSGTEVRVVLTAAALRFIRPETIRLFCDEVICPGEESAAGAVHVEVTRWATDFAILPASANMIGHAANGLCPSLLSSAVVAWEKPISFFPNMNLAMWRHPAVQRNVASLRSDGHFVIESEPASGYQVGGRVVGQGAVLPAPAVATEWLLNGVSTHQSAPCQPPPRQSAQRQSTPA